MNKVGRGLRRGAKTLVIRRSLLTVEEQATWDQDGKDEGTKGCQMDHIGQETETILRTVVLR